MHCARQERTGETLGDCRAALRCESRDDSPRCDDVAGFTEDLHGGIEMGLVLTRKEGQKIVLDGGLTAMIEVLEIRGDRVRLRIVADDDVKIDRLEVYESKLAERPGELRA